MQLIHLTPPFFLSSFSDEDLYAMAPNDSGQAASEKFERAWAVQLRKEQFVSLSVSSFACLLSSFIN